METKITVHPKNSIYFIISNATPEMVEEATKLVARKYAQVNGTNLVVHVNHVGKFRLMAAPAKVQKLDPHVCDHCGAQTEQAPDGSWYCPKFCN
jgi:formamidopyrimidine-DNA glycosylase